MDNNRHTELRSLRLLPAMLTATAAAAQTPEWDCVPCQSATGWQADIKAAPAYVDDDAFRFGNQTGLDEKSWNLFGDFNGRFVGDDAVFFNFEGYARGADANGLFLRGGKQGVYALSAFYQSVPQRVFGTTVTPFRGSGSDTLSLPNSWIRGGGTSQMTDLANSAIPVPIGLDWTNLGLGVDVDMVRNWNFSVEYVRREQEGVRRSAASFLFNGLEYAAPVDYASDNLTVGIDFSGASWEAGFKYYGSLFSNGNESLTWANPYLAINGDDQGRNAQPPDNESHQFALSAAVRLPGRTVLSGQASVGTLEQDERLLPYTINPSLVTAPLPTTSVNGKVDTSNLNLRAVTSPLRRLSLSAEFRYNDFDNQTPVNNFNYVITDVEVSPFFVPSNAFDYERQDLKLSGNYRLRRGMRLYAGFDTGSIKRTAQERRDTDTDRFWVRFRSRWARAAELDVRVFTEERDGSAYEVLTVPAAQQNPLMRKYNMADRDRDGWRARLSLLAIERLDLGVYYEEADDDYKNSTIGLLASDYSRAGADFSWSITPRASLYASIDREQIDSLQANSQGFGLPDWAARTEDEVLSGSVGASLIDLFGDFDVNLAYGWLDAKGRTRSVTNGLRDAFPDNRSERETLSVAVEYPWSEKLLVGVEFFSEELETDDWSLDGVDPATVSNLLGLGAEAWNYDQNVFYVSFRYLLAQ